MDKSFEEIKKLKEEVEELRKKLIENGEKYDATDCFSFEYHGGHDLITEEALKERNKNSYSK